MTDQVNSTNIGLISVNYLLGKQFHVPSYQRGFRWTTMQVGELLDDIWEFHNNSTKEEFYCLQPLVVAKQDDKWILIDGQQRLTTIFLILSYFNERLAEAYRKKLYSLSYETRPDSAAYLNNITEADRNKNIDYFYIYEAKNTVKKWFEDKQNIVNDYESTVLNRVKFIWYEVSQGLAPIDIFTRLNSGRIPLTNAELVRALFLRKGNFADRNDKEIYLKQLQIAGEWDRIEYQLQEKRFWYFLTDNIDDYPTRIEFIFDLMKKKPEHSDTYYTFHRFNDDLSQNKDIEEHWNHIKKYFMTFEEWFNDRQLYHWIGFLVTTDSKLIDLQSNAAAKTKTAFKSYLEGEIKKKVDYQLHDLDYDSNRSKIKNVLLLFNIITILSNDKSYLWFPFDSYKMDDWDIEHIRSIKSDVPPGSKQRGWLQEVREYFIVAPSQHADVKFDKLLDEDEKKIVQRLTDILNKDIIEEADFIELYNDLLVFFKEDWETDDINMISNLALLDARTNRGYKNAVFPVKRRTIIQRDMRGTFVPICTKNVFLKSYSKKPKDLMHWKKEDADDYLQAIKDMLFQYLPKQEDEAIQ